MVRLTPDQKSKSLNYIQELAYAFEKSFTLLSASDNGIFNALGDESLEAKEVAERCELDARATERLLNGLAALEIIEKHGQEFKNSELSKRFLLEGSDEYLGIMNHTADLLESWSHLNDCLKSGKPKDNQSIEEKSQEWVEAYVDASHWKAQNEAKDIIAKIDLRNVKKVLDLGAGTGQYAIELVRAKPDIEAVIFDYPSVTKLAEKHLDNCNMRDKIKILSGDFMKDDIGSGYDLVILSSVIHDLSIWDNVKLLQRVYDSMNIEGQVVINEIIIDDNRISPLNSAMYSLNMLVNTQEGDSYTETDIWIMLRESWFQSIYRRDTEFETSLIFATR